MSDKKKPKIKAFKPIAKAGQEETEELLSKISIAINKIYNFETSNLRYQEYYSYGYKLTHSKKEKVLYDLLKDIIQDKTRIITEQLKGVSRDGLLAKFTDLWNNHKTCTKYVSNIMNYLETGYIQQNRLVPLYDLGLITFKDLVFKDETLSPKLTSLLLEMIKRDRDGEMIERDIIKSISNMLIEVSLNSRQMYKEILEDSLFEETDKFYDFESKRLIDEIQASEFLKKAEERLEEEKRRVFSYLDISTLDPLLKIVDKKFIVNYSNFIVNSPSGLARMIDNMNVDDLSRMFRLYQRSPECLSQIHSCLSEYIERKGEEIVRDQDAAKNPLKLISDIIELRDKIIQLHNSAFKRDILIEVATRLSFEKFINKYTRTSLALVLYVDYLFQKEIRGLTEEEVENRLNKVVSIFKYISDKDLFENYYKSYLSKRLLSDKSLDGEAERLFVTKLKTECGTQYTSRIEGMLKDIAIAKQDSDKFQESSILEFEVRVLTQTFWPQDQLPAIILPSELASVAEKFTNYYMTQHSGRRLN